MSPCISPILDEQYTQTKDTLGVENVTSDNNEINATTIQSFPFFNLPAEIRSIVLYFALKHETMLHYKESGIGGRTADINPLVTSQRLSNEALPVFYSCNTFRIRKFADLAALPPWITHPFNNIVYVRKVHIDCWNYDCKLMPVTHKRIGTIVQALERCQKLALLRIIINFLNRDSRRTFVPDFDGTISAVEGVSGVREVTVERDNHNYLHHWGLIIRIKLGEQRLKE